MPHIRMNISLHSKKTLIYNMMKCLVFGFMVYSQSRYCSLGWSICSSWFVLTNMLIVGGDGGGYYVVFGVNDGA